MLFAMVPSTKVYHINTITEELEQSLTSTQEPLVSLLISKSETELLEKDSTSEFSILENQHAEPLSWTESDKTIEYKFV